MIFQRHTTPNLAEPSVEAEVKAQSAISDDVETIVGPSVNVEGDLSSSGNIVIKGMVTGSVNTTKLLTVEKGAKIVANVKAGSAVVAGEIKGNVKIKESLELTATSKVLGDMSVKTLTVEPGAMIYGKVTMPGVDTNESKVDRLVRRAKKGSIIEQEN